MLIALGADLKGAFALERDGVVTYRSGFGDLADPGRFDAWTEAIRRESGNTPLRAVLVDRHPLYHAHAEGRRLAARDSAALVALQHHHAHAAAVLDHARIEPPALGLILDGTGYGDDGTIWGCELLRISRDGRMERLGHLMTVPCPGGDRAAAEPWRMAAAWMRTAGLEADALPSLRDHVGGATWDAVWTLAATDAAPRTSSAGRLFDAVAAILGIRTQVAVEAEAATALEALAVEATEEVEPIPCPVAKGILDFAPFIRHLVEEKRRGVETARLAALFHATLLEGLARLVEVSGEGVGRIVLGGGCLLNTILAERLPKRLAAIGYDVTLPPAALRTDDAIPTGQLWIERRRSRRL